MNAPYDGDRDRTGVGCRRRHGRRPAASARPPFRSRTRMPQQPPYDRGGSSTRRGSRRAAQAPYRRRTRTPPARTPRRSRPRTRRAFQQQDWPYRTHSRAAAPPSVPRPSRRRPPDRAADPGQGGYPGPGPQEHAGPARRTTAYAHLFRDQRDAGIGGRSRATPSRTSTDAPDEPAPAPEASVASSGGGRAASLLKSSAVMAAGTLVSRVTGFVRTLVIAARHRRRPPSATPTRSPTPCRR